MPGNQRVYKVTIALKAPVKSEVDFNTLALHGDYVTHSESGVTLVVGNPESTITSYWVPHCNVGFIRTDK